MCHSERLSVSVLCVVLCLGLSPTEVTAQLPYVVVGEGEPTVIVLHGGPGATHSYLRPEWDRLAAFARVIYYDQRGCGTGAGEPGPVSWGQHVADLGALVESVSHERVILAGSSWGAMLALLFATAHPEQIEALVLSGVPPWPSFMRGDPSVPPRSEARLDSLEKGLPVTPWPAPDTLGQGDEQGAQAADERISDRVEVCVPAAEATFESLRGAPPVQALGVIDAPTLIFQGLEGMGRDEWGGQLSRYLPGATHVVVRGAGHDPWAAHPEEFFDRVSRFVEDLQRSRF